MRPPLAVSFRFALALTLAIVGCAGPPVPEATRHRPELPPGGDLRGADLRWSDLRRAALGGARLAHADLLDADLFGADLEAADLVESRLEHADLSSANLRRAAFVGADLRQATLRAADLRGADLAGARLGFADLRGARLDGARLERTSLARADLTGASLAHADLRHANLAGADLRGVRALTQPQLDAACLDSTTRLPPARAGGFRRPDRAPPGCAQREHRMAPANRGAERYSAWFGDSDGRVLYFGLSPFWELWREHAGDAAADLREPGDHLIGRFDLLRRRFLTPLRARGLEDGARGSVWDVLAHSGGRVFYTTFFEEIGSVAGSGDPRAFETDDLGWNELYEGRDGTIWVTRYADGARGVETGSVVALQSDGLRLRERAFPPTGGVRTAPKSLAVDPTTGEVWLNTDLFSDLAPDGARHDTIRLDAALRVIERRAGPELMFVTFDRAGRGWFAWDRDGQLVLEVRSPGGDVVDLTLGRRNPLDFLQDIKEAEDGTLVLTLWGGRVFLVEPAAGEFRVSFLDFERPPVCRAPYGNGLLYTAVATSDRVFATLHCGARVLELPRGAAHPWPTPSGASRSAEQGSERR